MPERKRAAPRLRHVADQNPLPASSFRGLWREAFQELHQFRMAPIAITRYSHHLPSRPRCGQFDTPLKTTARVVADRHSSAEAWAVAFVKIETSLASTSAVFLVRCSSKDYSAAMAHERRFSAPQRRLAQPIRPLRPQPFRTCHSTWKQYRKTSNPGRGGGSGTLHHGD